MFLMFLFIYLSIYLFFILTVFNFVLSASLNRVTWIQSALIIIIIIIIIIKASIQAYEKN